MIDLRKAILDANLFLKHESETWEYDGDEYMTLPPAQTLDSLRFIPSYRIQGKDYYFVVTWGRLYLASQRREGDTQLSLYDYYTDKYIGRRSYKHLCPIWNLSKSIFACPKGAESSIMDVQID